jgi:NAD(P)H-dependent FMN reductase
MTRAKRIVGLSGSLRTDSSNAALVRAAFMLVPAGIETVLYGAVGSLPHFNPDVDQEGSVPPPAVAGFRALLRSADGFIVSVPEYAHGLPGAFKNAIDWVVSSGEFGHKPVLVLNASAGGHHAQANLVETLTVIEARVLSASLLTPFLSSRITSEGSLSATDRATLQRSVEALLSAIDETRPTL